MANPTRISGTNDDGQLSGVELDTPVVTFVRDVPEFNTTATIDAAFSMVGPGSGTVNPNGDVAVQLQVAVDLHVVVPLLPEPRDCRSAPINLALSSAAPYDPETQRVTLTNPNFTVPAVGTSATCDGLIAGPVNDALAGAGHAISLTLQGALTVPTEGEPTATTLAVSPAGGSRVGDDVTLTATVAPAPAVAGAPDVSGLVTFFDGSDSLGAAPVDDDGVATLVTDGLLPGSHQLRASYGGAPPDWDPSTSPAVPYTVTADPFVTTTATGEVRPGGVGNDFDVTVTNTGFGAALDDARLEVSITRQTGFGAIGPDGGTSRITLSRVVDGAATAIPLTYTDSSPGVLDGSIGGIWDVPPGDEHTETLRLEVAAGVSVGPLSLTFRLVNDDDEAVLGSTNGVITIVNATRIPTTIFSGFAGFPPFIPSIPPVTPIVRQGNVVELGYLGVTPDVDSTAATGTYTFKVDGIPVPGQHNIAVLPSPGVWLERVPVARNAGSYLVRLPADVPIGTRLVTVSYSGDALFAPSQMSWPVTVEPSIGTLYECLGQGFIRGSFTANVEVQATVPGAWAAGQDIPVGRVEVRLRASRTMTHQDALTGLFQGEQDSRILELQAGPGGIIVPASIEQTNNVAAQTGDGLGPDWIVDLGAGTGVLPVDQAPGTTVDYTLDQILISSSPGGFLGGILCTPAPDAHVLGSVTAAGTTLTVDTVGPVGLGDEVALTASALPATPGSVEFRDGTITIGVVPVDANGTARMVTANLPAGARSLTARFFGGVVPTAPSAPVELRVIGECLPLDEGNGAVVRLVYMELLGRCPDAPGYAYWLDRLDGGTTPEVFARSIAATPEAVGRVVDDAYRTMLDRPADAAGRTFWTQRLLGHGRYDTLLADLGASPEFWSKAGSSNTGFVTRVYDRLLGRAPEQTGLDYWVGRLDTGISPRVLIVQLANLDEPLGVLVTDSYGEILDRAPDATERTSGIGHLRSTGDRSGLYAQLIGTGEFDQRAQDFPGA